MLFAEKYIHDKYLKTSKTFAVVFFIFWFAVMLAGADHPPPVGFIWVFVFDVIASWLVYIRVPVYMNWSRVKLKYRLLRAPFEGFVAGIVFAAFAMIFNPNGEPGVTPAMIDRIIWFAVVGIVGGINTFLLYGACVLVRIRAIDHGDDGINNS